MNIQDSYQDSRFEIQDVLLSLNFVCTITHIRLSHTCKVCYTHMKQIMMQKCDTYIILVIDELRNLQFTMNIINYTF